MPSLAPVTGNPFEKRAAPKLTPVDRDPFAAPEPREETPSAVPAPTHRAEPTRAPAPPPRAAPVPPMPSETPRTFEPQEFTAVSPDPFQLPVDAARPGDDPDIGRLQTAASQFARGATSVATGAVKGQAIQSAREVHQMVPLFEAIDRGEDVPSNIVPMHLSGFIDLYRKAGPDKRAEMRRQFGTAPQDSSVYKSAEKLDALVAKHAPTNPEFEKEFLTGKLPSGLGSATAFLATGILSRGARLPSAIAPSAMGSLVNRADTFEDALRHGASIEDAYKSSDFGAVVGLSEGVPVAAILSRLDKGTGGMVKRALVGAMIGGTEEAIQEATTSILNNLIASDLVAYDKDRDMWTGTGEAAGVGATTGGMFGFVTGLVGARRGRRRGPDDAPPDNLTPEDLSSPIDDSLLSEGKQIVQDAVAGVPPADAVPGAYSGQPQNPLTPDASTGTFGVEPDVSHETEPVPTRPPGTPTRDDLEAALDGDRTATEIAAEREEQAQQSVMVPIEGGRQAVVDANGGILGTFDTEEQAQDFIDAGAEPPVAPAPPGSVERDEGAGAAPAVPAALVQEVQRYVIDTKKPLNPKAMTRDIEADEADIRRALDQLVGDKLVRFNTKTGRFARTPKRGPLDMLQFIARNGGIRDDEGHDLRGSRNAQRFIPGFGPVIRAESGLSLDAMGELLHEAGYFGVMATTPRPDVPAILDALDRSIAGNPVYSEYDRPEIERREAEAAEQENARILDEARTEVAAVSSEVGVTLEDREAEEIAIRIAEGESALDIIGDIAERQAIQWEQNDEFDTDTSTAEDGAAGQGEAPPPFGEPDERPGTPQAGPETGIDAGENPPPAREAPESESSEPDVEAQPDIRAEPIPDLTPPPPPPKGIPNVGRLVESHGDIEIRVKSNGRFSVGSMRSGAWGSQYSSENFLEARAKAKEFAQKREETERVNAEARRKRDAEESAAPATDTTDQGEQHVIPGAEQRPQREVIERDMEGRKRSEAPQKGVDGLDLFDPDAREGNQRDIFDEQGDAKTNSSSDRTNSSSGETESDTVEGDAPTKQDRIEDFGEVIEGARKHLAAQYLERMGQALKTDTAAVPLSKSWPEPDYQKMLESGPDAWVVGFIHAARDEIPNKPRQGWKLKQWVQQVETMRGFADSLLGERITKDALQEKMAELRYSRVQTALADRIELYQEVGHGKSLKGVRIGSGQYSMRDGVKLEPPETVWTVEKPSGATALSNWPKILGEGKTRDEAIADFKKKYAEYDAGPATREVKFSVYSRRDENSVIIGKKVGRNHIDMERFDSVKEARAYLAQNHDKLVEKLERIKSVPEMRKAENSPRVGGDHRNGADATEEMFKEAFGFRGVQFGKYVEQGKRQQDMNEAYDALLDMAGILGIPPRALSLNGTLGLAFGARGKGKRGHMTPKAHFETEFVVINLTKKKGAGSLAHEWWHALDNYFSRARGQDHAFITEMGRASGEGVRPEMVEAFAGIMKSVRQTALQERAAKLDRVRTESYWSTGREMSARAFESYLVARLQDNSQSNDYLVNIVSQAYWDAAAALGLEQEGTYPYLEAAEIPVVRAAYDHFFDTVQTRETGTGDERKTALFSRPTTPRSITPLAAKQFNAVVKRVTSRWKAGVAIRPVASFADLPSPIQQAARDQGSDGSDVRGVFHDGTIYIVRGNISSIKEVEETLFHEGYGHLGMRLITGGKMRTAMANLYDAIGGREGMERIAKERNIDLSAYEDGLANESAETRESVLMDELLAHIAEQNRPGIKRAFKEAVGAVRAWLRRSGLIRLAQFNDSDLVRLLRRARIAVQSGEPGYREGFEDTPRFAAAWHGTPHDFDRFSTDAIGTGEGAQAYGYGLYFAGKREVAEFYRRKLSGGGDALFFGEQRVDRTDASGRIITETKAAVPVSATSFVSGEETYFYYLKQMRTVIESSLARVLSGSGESPSSAIARELNDFIKENKPYEDELHSVAKLASAAVEASKKIATGRAGSLLQVELAPEEDSYLLWDKPLSEQSESVKAALDGMVPERVITSTSSREAAERAATGVEGAKVKEDPSPLGGWLVVHDNSNVTGEQIYRSIAAEHRAPILSDQNSQKNASLALRDAGIPGIKYLDGSSRHQTPANDIRVWKTGIQHDGQEIYDVRGYLRGGGKAFEENLTEAAMRSFLGDELADRILEDQQSKQPHQKTEVDLPKSRYFGPGPDFNYVIFDEADVSITARFSRAPAKDSDAFKKWFGESKVVDENGEPMVVYHGTAGEFEAFDADLAGANFNGFDRAGIFFTNSAHEASEYADNAKRQRWEEDPYGDRFANVIPAYVSLQNPLVIEGNTDGRGVLWLSDNARRTDVEGALSGNKYDGVIAIATDQTLSDIPGQIAGQKEMVVIAKSPSQIKSIHNRGTFAPDDDRILFSRRASSRDRGGLFGNSFAAASESVWDFMRDKNKPLLARIGATAGAASDVARQKLQDRMLVARRIQEAIEGVRGEALPESQDTYLAEELYYGRTGKQLDDFRDKTVEPLVEAIAGEGLSLEQVDNYLYARHAPERNARIAEINEEMPDGGSGMTDEEAAEIMAGFQRDGLAPKLERIARKTDAITAATNRVRLDAGLVDEKTLKIWSGAYENYVPLRGFAEIDIDNSEPARPRTGKGFDIRGEESRRAMGRTSRAADILSNILSMHEEAIVRAEKNKVGQTFMRMVQANPNDDVWEIAAVEYKPRFNRESGMVEYGPDPRMTLKDNVLAVKVDGQVHHITIHHKALAKAMKNIGATSTNGLLRAMQKFNRWLAFVNTSANPEFVISNMARDLQTAGINMQEFDVPGLTKAVFRDVPKAMTGAFRGIRGDESSEWGQYFQEFSKEGGKTAFFALDDIQEQQRRINRILKDINPSNLQKVRELAVAIERVIQDTNAAVENAVRLSTYVNMRRNGVSVKQAASVAKNLTVNFNRKGEWAGTAQALYLFYNASFQGTVRMMHALKHRRVQQVVGGIVIAHVMLEIANGLMSPEDDDGERKYDKVTKYTKQHNILLANPWAGDDAKDVTALKLPMPYGYNVFAVTGQKIGEVIRSSLGIGPKVDPLEAAADLMAVAVESFNPMGGEKSVLRTLVPTALKPLYELETNRNFMDIPVMPEDPAFGVPKPDSEKSFKSVSPASKWFARQMNEMTGGNQVRPGAVDVSPETLDHWVQFMTGAAGAFISRTTGTIYRALSGDEKDIRWNAIPFARKVIEGNSEYYTRRRYYEVSDAAKLAEAELKMLRAAKDLPGARKARRERLPELRAGKLVKGVDKRLRVLRQRRRAIEADKTMTDTAKEKKLEAIEERSNKLMSRVLLLYNTAVRAKKPAEDRAAE